MEKDDVRVDEIRFLATHDGKTRKRLAKYCLRDAELAFLLLTKDLIKGKHSILVNYLSV